MFVECKKNANGYNPKRLSFSTFDIHSVMQNSALLMASDNVEYMSVKGNDAKFA